MKTVVSAALARTVMITSGLPEAEQRALNLCTKYGNTSRVSTSRHACSASDNCLAREHLYIHKIEREQVAVLLEKLDMAAIEVQSTQWRSEWLFFGRKIFLPARFLHRITDDFHLIASEDDLRARSSDWEYLADFGTALWVEVKKLREEMDEVLASRRRFESPGV